jgi:hypothetical protein
LLSLFIHTLAEIVRMPPVERIAGRVVDPERDGDYLRREPLMALVVRAKDQAYATYKTYEAPTPTPSEPGGEVGEAEGGNHGLTDAVKAIAGRYPMVAIARALNDVLPGLLDALNARLDRTRAERDDAMSLLAETAAQRDAALAARPGADDALITVCSSCLRACCWQGEFMCDEAEGAGTVQRKVSELRANPHGESEHYWQAEITAFLKHRGRST